MNQRKSSNKREGRDPRKLQGSEPGFTVHNIALPSRSRLEPNFRVVFGSDRNKKYSWTLKNNVFADLKNTG